MAKLKILKHPDSKLRTIATSVDKIDSSIRVLVDDMLETMYGSQGIGLAATQVNVHKQVFVIDMTLEQVNPLVFINPRIEYIGTKTTTQEEGCLSIPGATSTVKRIERIRVHAQDQNGDYFELEADGMLSVCIQHEVDHLNGKLYIDHLSSFKRNRVLKQLSKS